jgi:hypothetical protein
MTMGNRSLAVANCLKGAITSIVPIGSFGLTSGLVLLE